MEVLSDGAFRLYIYLCLNADRASGRFDVAHGDLAEALGKSRRSIMTYLAELRRQGVCHTREAVNQHCGGHIEICDPFWPYFKTVASQETADGIAVYVDRVRRSLIARCCFGPIFRPADERSAEGLYREHIPVDHVEHGILLACARRYVALLNGTARGRINGLQYFQGAIEEARQSATSADYWRYLEHRVGQLEREWVATQQQSPVLD
jgi:hypothetical protein